MKKVAQVKKPTGEPKKIPTVSIAGARADWVVDAGEEKLAVIHSTWWSGKDVYRDPMKGVDTGGKRYREYVAKLQETDRVVLQRDKGNGSLERDSFVGVFSFSDLLVDPAGPVELKLVARTANQRK